jgi:hypothetical protein
MDLRIIELLKEIKSMLTGSTDKWLDIQEASKYCSLSVSSLRRGIANGSLKASDRLGKKLILRSSLEAWLGGK